MSRIHLSPLRKMALGVKCSITRMLGLGCGVSSYSKRLAAISVLSGKGMEAS